MRSHCRKDVALPWITDPRWEADTLFLVFEEDFRFTPGHDMEPLPEDTGESRAVGEHAGGARATATAEAASLPPRRGQRRAVGVHYEVPRRAARTMFAHVSQPHQ